jgi:hypothetical protein
MPSTGLADASRDSAAAWGDLDRDGWLDLYVAAGDNCAAPEANRGVLKR